MQRFSYYSHFVLLMCGICTTAIGQGISYQPAGLAGSNVKAWFDAYSVSNGRMATAVNGTGAFSATDSTVKSWGDRAGSSVVLQNGLGTHPVYNKFLRGVVFTQTSTAATQVGLTYSGTLPISGTGAFTAIVLSRTTGVISSQETNKILSFGPYGAAAGTSFALSTTVDSDPSPSAARDGKWTNGNVTLYGLAVRNAGDYSLARKVFGCPSFYSGGTTPVYRTGTDTTSITIVSKTAGATIDNQLLWNNGYPIQGAGQTVTAPTTQVNIGAGSLSLGCESDGSSANRGYGFNGIIHEVILLDKALASTERVLMANYLQTKWNATTPIAITDDYYVSATHTNDLIGVGKATATAGDEVTQSVAPSRGLLLSAGTASWTPGSYLLAAHDGADSSAVATGLWPGWRLKRTWYIDQTGAPSGNATITFHFPSLYQSSTVYPHPVASTKYYLLRSATSAFTTLTIVDSVATGENPASDLISFSPAAETLTDGYYTLGTQTQDGFTAMAYAAPVTLTQTEYANIEVTSTGSVTINSNTTRLRGKTKISGNGQLIIAAPSATTLEIDTLDAGTGTLSVQSGKLSSRKLRVSGGSVSIASGTVTTDSLQVEAGSVSFSSGAKLTSKRLRMASGTVTIGDSSRIVSDTVLFDAGTLALNGTDSCLIISEYGTFRMGTGNVTKSGNAKAIKYRIAANLDYNGHSNLTAGIEWPMTPQERPTHVKVTGNSTIMLNEEKLVTGEFSFNNGIIDLNGRTLRLTGSAIHSNGRIKGGPGSRVYINGGGTPLRGGGSPVFQLPEILDSLQTLIVDRSSEVVALNGNVMVYDSLVLNQGFLSIGNNTRLTVAGRIYNNGGQIDGGSTSILQISDNARNKGKVTLPTINYGLGRLIIDRKDGVDLGDNLVVIDSVVMNTGALNVLDKTLYLDAAGTIGKESAARPISGTTGKISTTRMLNKPNADPVGNIGVTFTSPADFGLTLVERKFQPRSIGGAGSSIARSYTITPTNNAGLSAQMIFSWRDSELNGEPENLLGLLRSTDGGATWTRRYGIVDTAANTLTLAGIDAFSDWTADNTNDPLPVELTSFSGQLRNGTVRLQWRTATETNCQGFEIQRRIDDAASNQALRAAHPGGEDVEWSALGFVAGSGTTSSPQSYSFSDVLANIPSAARSVTYRLRQLDRDGTFEFSPELRISLSDATASVLTLSAAWPNPSASMTSVSFSTNEGVTASVRLYGVDGREVRTIEPTRLFEPGVHAINVPRGTLQPGTYFLVLEGEQVGRLVRTCTFIR